MPEDGMLNPPLLLQDVLNTLKQHIVGPLQKPCNKEPSENPFIPLDLTMCMTGPQAAPWPGYVAAFGDELPRGWLWLPRRRG